MNTIRTRRVRNAAAIRAKAGAAPRERGVASVLSMLFLIMFGSLATAMAIASRGNIRTAATHQHVLRAQSAAETGMQVAQQRMTEAASRFVVSYSDIDEDFGSKLWSGTAAGMGTISVIPPPSGFGESSTPSGIAQAVANRHAADENLVTSVSVSAPTIGGAMAGVDLTEYQSTNWLYTPAVSIETSVDDANKPSLAFSVTYAPLANGTDVRVIVTGYDFNYDRDGEPIQRTIMQDFRMVKRVNQAIIAPSKIMIGKNVHIAGDLGAAYDQVSFEKGDPLVLKSDFLGLDPILDQKLSDFMDALVANDVDHDNRLRVGHPVEGSGLPPPKDYDGNGSAETAIADATGDGYVDDFDVFIRHYDKNGDGRLVLSTALTNGTPAAGLAAEFVTSGGNPIDDDLAILIDSMNPDRNKNDIYGFVDSNANGIWDAGEAFIDHDAATSVNRDQVMGYRDGFLDKRDMYSKVKGRLTFRTSEAAWLGGQGDVYSNIQGTISPGFGRTPLHFAASTPELPLIDDSTFDESNTALKNAANGQDFWQQVADQIGTSVAGLGVYTEVKPPSTTSPRYLRVDGDANNDGKPDNWTTAYFEKMPFNSPNYSDWYYRPVFENMVFRDAKIPQGVNGLFKNCTFVGVTYVQTYSTNTHVLWGEYGKQTLETSTGRPGPTPQRTTYGDDVTEIYFPTMLPSTAKPPLQTLVMASPEMDKADVPANMTGRPGYDVMPEPLIIAGKRVTDTKTLSNNIRFHDCLFVGSIVSDKTSVYTQVRNKLQFTGATRFATKHPDAPSDASLNPQSGDMNEILKSSMMLPNYSVDVGSFNSPTTQDVRLQGAIVAGIMDIRGNATIEGALLLTYKPTYGAGPMKDALNQPVGNPAGFNATIGYFGPDDGDSEALDPQTLPIYNGQKYVGWDTTGDGLADLGPNQTPTQAQLDAGATRVPFYGYGHIELRFNPNQKLPNGIMLPMQFEPLSATYREGHP